MPFLGGGPHGFRVQKSRVLELRGVGLGVRIRSCGAEFGSNTCSKQSFPDPQEDLESRSPNLGPYTTKGTL